MNFHQAAMNVASRYPSFLNDEGFKRRLDRAFAILTKGGYEITKANNVYHVNKASTSLFEDNSVTYNVTDESCDCPDFERGVEQGTLRGNLCKHRLAVMMLKELQGE